MKAISMESPNNERDRILPGHLLLPNETSSTRIGLCLIELMAKRTSGESQTSWAVAKITGCSPQTDSKAPLLKITPTQLTEPGDVELVPT